MEQSEVHLDDAAIREKFPDIYEAEARQAILENGIVMEVPAGERMMDIGQYIKFMPLVLEGSLKVMREDNDGNELLLYYLGPGQTCAMSMTCCMGDAKSNVRAEAEENTTIIAIPVRFMDEWTSKYRSFKGYVMLNYQRRFEELLQTVDGIAFQKLDDRLINALREKARAQGNRIIQTTHQELANELNSSREVISRVLKQMERRDLVRLGRNKIELLGA
jgi:CRP/FNR family transcriptional regulator, anaerobic regulatory protein